jgi:hypothetical protein
VVEGEEIVDLAIDPDFPTDMVVLLEAGADGLKAASAAALRSTRRFAIPSVRIEAPVLKPRKFLGLGGSYKSHLAEVAHLGTQPCRFQTWLRVSGLSGHK